MTREIKFRGYSKLISDYVYGDLVHYDDVPHIKAKECVPVNIDHTDLFEVVPETIQQLWKTCAVGSIFEGDIEEDDLGVLTFGAYLEENDVMSANSAAPVLDEKYGWHWKYPHGDCSSATCERVVVGNAISNPELLTQSN